MKQIFASVLLILLSNHSIAGASEGIVSTPLSHAGNVFMFSAGSHQARQLVELELLEPGQLAWILSMEKQYKLWSCWPTRNKNESTSKGVMHAMFGTIEKPSLTHISLISHSLT